MKKEKLYLLTYFVIMGVGLVLGNFVFNAGYNSPNFLHHVIWVLVVLLAFSAVFYLRNIEDYKVNWNQETKPSYVFALIAAIPVVLIVAYLLVRVFAFSIAFVVPLTAAILVGFAEEICFRGILLNKLLKVSTPGKALLFSSLAFSLLHALNVLGGAPIVAVLGQLVTTFFSGMFMGGIYLKTKNLAVPIIFHGMWDYMVFTVVGNNVAMLKVAPPVLGFLTTVLALVMLIQYFKKTKADIVAS